MKTVRAILIAIPLVVLVGSASASTIIQDGTFLSPIGIGLSSPHWNDWTNAGIKNNHAATTPIPGNWASIPVGGDLFQRFNALSQGTYTASFFVQYQQPWTSELVFGVQTALGTPVSEVFGAGTGGLIILPPSPPPISNVLPPSALFYTLSFTIGPQTPYVANELYFSNSYNFPEPVIANSINPPGTIINIADVSLIATVPEPSTWAMMLIGFAGLSYAAYRQKKKNAAVLVAG